MSCYTAVMKGDLYRIERDGIDLSSFDVVEQLRKQEEFNKLLLSALVRIRYGSLRGKGLWLCSNFPDTFGSADEFFATFEPEIYSAVKDLSLDAIIAAELISILQEEK